MCAEERVDVTAGPGEGRLEMERGGQWPGNG